MMVASSVRDEGQSRQMGQVKSVSASSDLAGGFSLISGEESSRSSMGCSLFPAAISFGGAATLVRSCLRFRVELRVIRRAGDGAEGAALRVRRGERDDMTGA